MRTQTTRAVLLACAVLVSGCGDDETNAAPPGPLHGELSLELRDTATITISPGAGDATSVTVTTSAGFGLLPANVLLTGEGHTELLVEASSTLYTAKLEAPAQAGGLCGSEPVSLALSLHRPGLHRPGESAMVIGGISAYCGAGVWYGAPVRVLRLAGELK